MALALKTFINFESGSLHELIWTEGSPTIETSPAPPYGHETYVVELEQDSVNYNEIFVDTVPTGENKYVIGFYVRFSYVGRITDFEFFQWCTNGTAIDFRLKLNDNGAFSIYDANNALVIKSSNGVFSADTWHLVEFLLTHGDPGDLIVHVDGSEALNTSGEDYDGSS